MEEKRVDKLEEKVDTIMDNHLVHIKDSIFDMDLKFTKALSTLDAKVERWITNTEWLVKFFWVATTSAIGSLVATLIGLWKG